MFGVGVLEDFQSFFERHPAWSWIRDAPNAIEVRHCDDFAFDDAARLVVAKAVAGMEARIASFVDWQCLQSQVLQAEASFHMTHVADRHLECLGATEENECNNLVHVQSYRFAIEQVVESLLVSRVGVDSTFFHLGRDGQMTVKRLEMDTFR